MDNQKAIEEFEYTLCQALLDEGATYASIILTTNGNVLSSYSTSPKWESAYHESGLSKSCHLIKASKILSQKSDNFTVIWDLLMPDNEVSSFLNAKRKEKKICHGVSFCKKNVNGILEVLSIAGRFSDVNFPSQVIKNKEKIKKYFTEYKQMYLEK